MINNFKLNRDNFIDKMENKSIALFASGSAPHKTTDQFYFYTPNKNFYYLTGLEEENFKLLLRKDGKTSKAFLFIEETTDHIRKWEGERMSKEDAALISGIDVKNIFYLSSFASTIETIMSFKRGLEMAVPNTLYLDLYRVKPGFPVISKTIFKNILDEYTELTIKNANEHLSYLRMFKHEYEINALKEAINITDKGLKRIMYELKNRDNEAQIEADFLHEITINGAATNSFNTITASGVNAAVLHYEDNNSPLNKSDLILCDLGALYKNYGSDITRTYPVSGTFSDRQKVIYQIVLDVNKAAIQFVKPGITWKELNDYAKDMLASKCIEIGLIKEKSEIINYYYHSIGHFLGLDVHDVGHYNLKLQPGMVLTIEPGLYIKEEGIGVRIEDDILVTDEGSINLSKDIIKEIKDIEAFMK